MEAEGLHTVRGISVWFSPRNELSKRSYITAMDYGLHGWYGYNPIQFYALNGFQDVDIDYRGS